MDVHVLCPYATLGYDNGAKVNTCFVHNLPPKGVTISCELRERLLRLEKTQKRERKKYQLRLSEETARI